MTYQALIQRAKQAKTQEIWEQGTDRWWVADQMPNQQYWREIEHYPAKNLTVQEDERGAIIITRTTLKGTCMGRLAGRDLIAQETLIDKRRFT